MLTSIGNNKILKNNIYQQKMCNYIMGDNIDEMTEGDTCEE